MHIHRPVALLVVLALLQSPRAEAAPAAKTLLRRARVALAGGQHERALELFREASEQHPDDAMVHYQHARALARLRAAGEVCEHDVYLRDVADTLIRAVELDGRLRARAIADPALAELRGTALFLRWRGIDLRTDAGLRKALPLIEWEGNLWPERKDSISFSPGGIVQYSHPALPGSRGRYRVDRGRVLVTYRWAGRSGSFVLQPLLEESSISLVRDGVHIASDHPDECNI